MPRTPAAKKPCGHCGAPISTWRKYCSAKCSGEARQSGTTLACLECGQQFYVSPARSGRAKCCSTTCQVAWQGRNKAEYGCMICGAQIRVPRSTRARKYCSITCREADPATAKLRIRNNQKLQAGMQTEPERIGYGILERLGLPYRAQHLVARKFCVDAYLPEQKVVVQFDGDYWHGHPAKYATLDARQARRVNHDRSQDAYMAKLGYRVIRIWESDLKKRPEAVQETLRKALADGSSYALQ